jgi:hypothetical protein
VAADRIRRRAVLRSNLAFYLAPGAVLRYTGDAAHYVVDGYKTSQARNLTWFISTRYSSTNISIYGRGIIDGNGQAALAPSNLGVNLLMPVYTSGFTVGGVTLRESSSWAIIPLRSSDLTIYEHVAFWRILHAPRGSRRLIGIDGVDRLRELPGVEEVRLRVAPGDEVDWAAGYHGSLRTASRSGRRSSCRSGRSR